MPAIRLQELHNHAIGFVTCHGAPATAGEEFRIGFRLHLENAVHGHHKGNEIVDGTVPLIVGERGVVAREFQFVQNHMLAFVLPMEKEHVLEKFGQFGIGCDTLPIVVLHEKFDVQRQYQNGPGGFAEHGTGHHVRVDVEAITFGHRLGHHLFDAAEQGLMFQFFVAETHKCFERHLIAQPVILSDLQQFRGDESFDESKNVGIGAALDLAREAALVGRKRIHFLHQREAVGKILLRHIEAASPDDVLIYFPMHRF